MIEALRASPCLSSNCAVAPCRAPPPHLLAASIAPHAARRLNRTEASHQPSLGRALALHPRSISLPPVPCRHRSRSRTFARPSVRSSIRPLTRFSSLSLSILLLPFARPFPRAPSRFLFPPARTTNRRSLGYSDARLPLSPSSFPRLPALALANDVRCVRCAALLHLGVRCALCALRAAVPSPARARALARSLARCAAWRTEASGG